MERQISNEVFFAEVERILDEGSHVTLRVRGNSMRPLLRDGRDSVTIRRHREEEIRRGAVMFFRHRGAHVMHRIKSVAGDEIVFAGDGNYRREEHARREDIIAVVTAVTRPGGRTADCSGRRWRAASAAWLMLPASVRRCILGILRRLDR